MWGPMVERSCVMAELGWVFGWASILAVLHVDCLYRSSNDFVSDQDFSQHISGLMSLINLGLG